MIYANNPRLENQCVFAFCKYFETSEIAIRSCRTPNKSEVSRDANQHLLEVTLRPVNAAEVVMLDAI